MSIVTAPLLKRPGKEWPGHSLVMREPLRLDCGVDFGPFTIAYQTYGKLNPERSNAILICHALTGDQYAAEPHPITGSAGWWTTMVGPGGVLDTERYFLVCANVLGGCMGTTGPKDINSATGAAWALDFPVITIHDMVRAQKLLLEHLGIDTLFAVIGGSMGAMQVLQWASTYPEAVYTAVPVAASARHSAQNIAFHEVGRQAIMADPDWCGGRYLSLGRNLQDRKAVTYGFDADFQVESYLRHQGSTFVDRFDANSYLYITRAMDYFDLAAEHGGSLPAAFPGKQPRFCIISFTSDWLFPTSESRALVHALNAVAANVSFVEIETDKGHDAFLLHEPELFATLRGFLTGSAEQRGLTRFWS